MSTDELREVAPADWHDAVAAAHEQRFTFFDWLSAVDRSHDEAAPGDDVVLRVLAFPRYDSVVGSRLTAFRALRLTTRVPAGAALASVTDVYAGAAWHERETHEMFGIGFARHPDLRPLLLPPEFEGHPLRKEFVLASRVAKAWPGAKEPGESEAGTAKRAPMRPPGVPDPNEWGPLKGTVPPPEPPARRARPAREES